MSAINGRAERILADGVKLEELLFTMSWEDPDLDRAAFAGVSGARIATVASGGCNALAFLLDDPREVFAFDFNATQVWLVAIKIAAIRTLEDAELYELLGIRPSTRRRELFARVAAGLTPEARNWGESQAWMFEWGLLGGGRYERFTGLFRKLLRLVQGRRIEALFEARDEAGRVQFYDQQWDTALWRLLFRAFFNKPVLAWRGLSPDYFTFDDGSASFADSFLRRTSRALRDLPVRENPFVAWYTLGRYLDEAHLPSYLQPENLATIRARLDRITVAQGDARYVFDGMEAGRFDAICLSNVCELMSVEDTRVVFEGAARALASGGRLTLRNLMVPRSAPPEIADRLVLSAELSRDLLARDRSFVYRSVQVYSRTEAA